MSNEILKFADTATNILTQAEYAADVERNSGNIPGVARSKLVNKVLRQCAFISNAFAEYMIAKIGGDVLDNNDTAALVAKMTSVFTVVRTNDNFFINSNFDVWQRGTTITANISKFGPDRWKTEVTGSTSIMTRQSTLGTESFNAKYFLRTTVTSVAGSGNLNLLRNGIEDVRKFAGKTLTLSFWAKADASKNICIEFLQNFGTGGSPSTTVTSIGTQTCALTTSWQKFTKTFTVPSIAGKIIGSNENSWTALNIWLDAGSTFNSRTNSLGQQSGTFDFAQFKLEFGAEATEFVLAGLTDDGEQAACNWYCQRVMGTYWGSRYAGASGNDFSIFGKLNSPIRAGAVFDNYSSATVSNGSPSTNQIGFLNFSNATYVTHAGATAITGQIFGDGTFNLSSNLTAPAGATAGQMLQAIAYFGSSTLLFTSEVY